MAASKDPTQAKHADKIRTERELMELTGLSRTQIREGLREFKLQVEAQRVPKLDQEARPEAPEIKVSEVEQRTGRMPIEGAGQGGNQNGGQVPAAIPGIIVMTDGFARYMSVNGLLGDLVV